jgi:hypothetical protein
MVPFLMSSLDTSVLVMLPATLWPFDPPATNSNEFQGPSRGQRAARKADNLTTICEGTLQNVGTAMCHNAAALLGLLQG